MINCYNGYKSQCVTRVYKKIGMGTSFKVSQEVFFMKQEKKHLAKCYKNNAA